jgi:cytidine deaminase
MKDLFAGFKYKEYNISEITKRDNELLEAAKLAAKDAYAPYSNFKVGAAVRLANDQIIKASNQENAAYPSGLCAERVALFYCGANFPDIPVKEIAIVALGKNSVITEKPVPPCGACRQVIVETSGRFKQTIRLLLVGKESVYEIENADDLLPLLFDTSYL